MRHCATPRAVIRVVAQVVGGFLRPSHENPFPPHGRPSTEPTLPATDVGPSASIRRRPEGEGDVKELRVKIDVSYHLKLHALKLLRNKRMSDAIEEALDYYFEHVVQAGGDIGDSDGAAKRLF